MKQAGGGLATRKSAPLRLKKNILYSALVNIIHIVDLTKRKLKVALLKQTEKKFSSNKESESTERVHI